MYLNSSLLKSYQTPGPCKHPCYRTKKNSFDCSVLAGGGGGGAGAHTKTGATSVYYKHHRKRIVKIGAQIVGNPKP